MTALPKAPKTPREALAFLRQQHESGSTAWYGMCEKLAHEAYGIPAKYPDAWTTWLHVQDKHPCTSDTVDWSQVPVGANLFYSGGTYGHVATFVGVTKVGPLCWTNDAAGRGLVSMVNPLWFELHWAHYLVGWGGDNDGYDLGLTMPHGVKKPPPDQPPKGEPTLKNFPALNDWRNAGIALRKDHPHWADVLTPAIQGAFWIPAGNKNKKPGA